MPKHPSIALHPLLEELALSLRTWRGVELFGARDVLTWTRTIDPPKVSVAFQGDALRLLNRAIRPQALPNHGYSLDIDLQRILGFPGRMSRAGGGNRAYPERQTMSEPDPHISEVLMGVEQLAAEWLAERGWEATVDATLMPEEGRPWSPAYGDTPTPWYSARRHTPDLTPHPPWVVEVETRQGRALGADFCRVTARTETEDQHLVAEIDGSLSLLTHAVDPVRRSDFAKLVKACGGLLFPSLAFGQVPATPFGALVLVAPPGLALAGMKPYSKRGGRWPVVAYDTDAWTSRTSDYLGDGSAELFADLTGAPQDWQSKNHIWVLGPPYEQGGTMTEPKRIESTRRLAARLRSFERRWKPTLSAEEIQKLSETSDRYPYVECKSNMIVDQRCFRLAVCPEALESECKTFLRNAGFRLKLVTVEGSPDRPSPGRDGPWDYGWEVRRRILGAAQKEEAAILHVALA